ncbi:MAG: deoxyribodipyrimidine photolyase [Proteobacteria bacterium]|nr:deoxyribodipyrimidine photolyase [Pseudomonadota bacterium]
MSVAIVWFRRDLRLTDNPALEEARASADVVVPVYLHAPEEDGRWSPGAASRWWLHRSLSSLAADLDQRGSRLVIRRGPSLEALLQLAKETGATSVHWNRLYEPAAIARDRAVKSALVARGLHAASQNGHLLFEPWTVQTRSGDPYRVFTPFWKTCMASVDGIAPPRAAPRRIGGGEHALASVPLEELDLAPRIRWDAGLAEAWQPGEPGALKALDTFTRDALADYGRDRDRPDVAGTSRISPHLHFGELSPRQALAAARQAAPGGGTGADAFVRELGWREFAHHLLYHYPHTVDTPLDGRFERLDWRRDTAQLAAWQRGLTGYPVVDAGMRELWHTGWMHNRVRMVVASLLTKNLFMHWLEGARWFWDTLVDADLANNTLGWQWTAGCGADAAPYYRVFNPVLQAEKFDPGRHYIRRWIPELAALPDRWVHCPWAAPADALAAAGVTPGVTYPEPIVDPRGSRDDALRRFEALKAGA